MGRSAARICGAVAVLVTTGIDIPQVPQVAAGKYPVEYQANRHHYHEPFDAVERGPGERPGQKR